MRGALQPRRCRGIPSLLLPHRGATPHLYGTGTAGAVTFFISFFACCIYLFIAVFIFQWDGTAVLGSSSASMEIPRAAAPEPLLSDLAACTQLQIFNLQ